MDSQTNMGDALPTLNPGDVIKQVYQVNKKLAEGGLKAVYLVKDKRTKEKKAMKIEEVKVSDKELKMERNVLEAFMKRGSRHVCKLLDKGRSEKFDFVIMTLVGENLKDLRKACPGAKFSIGSALRVGIQCMEALEDLHGIGFIHRDVKPGNFACGRAEINQHRTIYILDFGLSRNYKNSKGEIRDPRSTTDFRGTVRYAPLRSHYNQELSRKDDLETWFYQQVEITRGKLPWSMLVEKGAVERYKILSRTSGELIEEVPRQYYKMLCYIDSLGYWDTPDYKYIYRNLRQCMDERKVQESDPYGWERGGQHRQSME
ncbi:MAG: protein kinase [Gammaproteobacteria bacterium]|nr:protein kinase [Gammaproteobacteria bacterium]